MDAAKSMVVWVVLLASAVLFATWFSLVQPQHFGWYLERSCQEISHPRWRWLL